MSINPVDELILSQKEILQNLFNFEDDVFYVKEDGFLQKFKAEYFKVFENRVRIVGTVYRENGTQSTLPREIDFCKLNKEIIYTKEFLQQAYRDGLLQVY